jgi:hypothetical protein
MAKEETMFADVSKLNTFYYHKVGRGNKLAQHFLSGDHPIGRPAALILFWRITPDDILRGNFPVTMSKSQRTQAINFVESADPMKRDETCIVVVGTKVWLLKPDGEIEVWPGEGYNPESSLKLLPVEIMVEADLKDIPRILANIGSNQFLGRGTYRPITEECYRGNLKAIYTVLRKPWEQSWYEDTNPSGLFECLDSVELETLVAKILEAQGCFVPAYRGGYLKHVDLFAKADTAVNIDGLMVDNSGVQIQVKGRARLRKGELLPDTYLIGYDNRVLSEDDKRRYFDEDWLLKQCQSNPQVSTWLRKSLEWVPNDFLAKFI